MKLRSVIVRRSDSIQLRFLHTEIIRYFFLTACVVKFGIVGTEVLATKVALYYLLLDEYKKSFLCRKVTFRSTFIHTAHPAHIY